jgi:hypothetical protein
MSGTANDRKGQTYNLRLKDGTNLLNKANHRGVDAADPPNNIVAAAAQYSVLCDDRFEVFATLDNVPVAGDAAIPGTVSVGGFTNRSKDRLGQWRLWLVKISIHWRVMTLDNHN